MNTFSFAPLLKLARQQAGVGVNEQARRMGVRPSAICRIESGKNALLETTIAKYVDALGLVVNVVLRPAPSAPSQESRAP